MPLRFSRSPSPFDRATSVPPLFNRASSLEPLPLRRLRASSLEPLDSAINSKFDIPLNLEPRSMSPTPVKPGRWAPRQTEIAYDPDGKFLLLCWYFCVSSFFNSSYVKKSNTQFLILLFVKMVERR